MFRFLSCAWKVETLQFTNLLLALSHLADFNKILKASLHCPDGIQFVALVLNIIIKIISDYMSQVSLALTQTNKMQET